MICLSTGFIYALPIQKKITEAMPNTALIKALRKVVIQC